MKNVFTVIVLLLGISLLTSCRTGSILPQKDYDVSMSELDQAQIEISMWSGKTCIVLGNESDTIYIVNDEIFTICKERYDEVFHSLGTTPIVVGHRLKRGDPDYHFRSLPPRKFLEGQCSFLARSPNSFNKRNACFLFPNSVVPKGASYLVFECYDCNTNKPYLKSIKLKK